MNILLTNDDGYDAAGIKALYNILKKKHNVYIFAPKFQKSGASHSITLFAPIVVQEVSSNIFSVDGTPADCILVAKRFLKNKISIDLVVSGINQGQNIGEDVYYSGTVGAAREATFQGISAIAVSVFTSKSDFFYTPIAQTILHFIDKNLCDTIGKREFLNINFPGCKNSQIKGVKLTKLGRRRYVDFAKNCEHSGKTMTFYLGAEKMEFQKDADSDVYNVKKGFISITPICENEQNPTTCKKLTKWIEATSEK